ncbi:MAG: ACT domain-containing protein [Planctomycetota bacterium]
MKYKCEQVEQLTLNLENQPGILADLCAHLGDHGVNVRAISAADSTDAGNVRLVVNDPKLAKESLTKAGVDWTSTHCLALDMPNNPGALAEFARRLSLAGINIDYFYASATAGTVTAFGVLGVSDLERAMSIDWEH